MDFSLGVYGSFLYSLVSSQLVGGGLPVPPHPIYKNHSPHYRGFASLCQPEFGSLEIHEVYAKTFQEAQRFLEGFASSQI